MSSFRCTGVRVMLKLADDRLGLRRPTFPRALTWVMSKPDVGSAEARGLGPERSQGLALEVILKPMPLGRTAPGPPSLNSRDGDVETRAFAGKAPRIRGVLKYGSGKNHVPARCIETA